MLHRPLYEYRIAGGYSMNEPQISIIIPVYNVELLLKKCIDSVLRQTLTDIEVILVDDGSTDSCGAICDEYAAKDSRITVIHKKNGGLSDARNAGLEIISGKTVAFIDSDDFIHPQMMELLFAALQKEEADIAQCELLWFSSYDQIPDLFYDSSHLNTVRSLERDNLINHFYPDNGRVVSCTVCNKLYRREIFQDIRFPVGQYYEDTYIKLQTLDICQKLVLLPYKLYYYYQRPGSITHSNYNVKWFGAIKIFQKRITFFQQRKLMDQVRYAQVEYFNRYCKDFFAVYVNFPQYKKDFLQHKQAGKKLFFQILSNPYLCKMHKIMWFFSFVSPKTAYRLCCKYFPELLHSFMRLGTQLEVSNNE